MTLLISLLVVGFLAAFSNGFAPKHLRSGALQLKSATRQLKTCLQLIDEDERPKLTYQDENDGPRVSVKDLDEVSGKKEVSTPPSSSASTTPAKTKTTTFGTVSADELRNKWILKDIPIKKGGIVAKEDLNGIQPAIPILFSTFPAAMSFVFWQVSVYLTAHFAIDFVESPLYPVQRLAFIGRNLVVGISTLAAGFSGVVSLGLFLMGCAVAIGVAKGELDPNKEVPPAPKKNEY